MTVISHHVVAKFGIVAYLKAAHATHKQFFCHCAA